MKLDNGETIDVISNVCKNIAMTENMPIAKGFIANQEVEVLRDTGCNGVIVKKKFVKKENYTGEFGHMLLVDKTLIRAPFVNIDIDTPYGKGNFRALCLPDAIHDLIIGNVLNAKQPDNDDIKGYADDSKRITEAATATQQHREELKQHDKGTITKLQDTVETCQEYQQETNGNTKETLNGIGSIYLRPEMTEDIQGEFRSCSTCQEATANQLFGTSRNLDHIASPSRIHHSG